MSRVNFNDPTLVQLELGRTINKEWNHTILVNGRRIYLHEAVKEVGEEIALKVAVSMVKETNANTVRYMETDLKILKLAQESLYAVVTREEPKKKPSRKPTPKSKRRKLKR